MAMHPMCQDLKAHGTTCAALPHLLDGNDLCPAPRPDSREAMATRGTSRTFIARPVVSSCSGCQAGRLSIDLLASALATGRQAQAEEGTETLQLF